MITTGSSRVIEQDQSFFQITYTLIGYHIKKISRSFDRGFNLSEQGFDFISNPRAMRNTPSSLISATLAPTEKPPSDWITAAKEEIADKARNLEKGEPTLARFRQV